MSFWVNNKGLQYVQAMFLPFRQSHPPKNNVFNITYCGLQFHIPSNISTFLPEFNLLDIVLVVVCLFCTYVSLCLSCGYLVYKAKHHFVIMPLHTANC